MTQEKSYFEALRSAERFTMDGTTLQIFYKGNEKPFLVCTQITGKERRTCMKGDNPRAYEQQLAAKAATDPDVDVISTSDPPLQSVIPIGRGRGEEGG